MLGPACKTPDEPVHKSGISLCATLGIFRRVPAPQNNLPSPQMTEIPTTFRASFAIGDERRARLVVDRLNESFEDGETAVAAFERSDGAWDIALNFAAPPDEATVRALMAFAAGGWRWRSLSPRSRRDWVAASLEGLAPVVAGRFVVHGAHDRDKVPANSIGIEIEAALAFGTGHHGTTRGCLLACSTHGAAAPPAPPTCSTSAPAPACSPLPPPGRCAATCGRATSTAHRSPSPATTSAATAPPLDRPRPAGGVGDRRIVANAPYAIVLANILLPPLKRMAAPMARLVAPAGHVILSGVLDTEAAAILAAYRSRGLGRRGGYRWTAGPRRCCAAATGKKKPRMIIRGALQEASRRPAASFSRRRWQCWRLVALRRGCPRCAANDRRLVLRARRRCESAISSNRACARGPRRVLFGVKVYVIWLASGEDTRRTQCLVAEIA